MDGWMGGGISGGKIVSYAKMKELDSQQPLRILKISLVSFISYVSVQCDLPRNPYNDFEDYVLLLRSIIMLSTGPIIDYQ